MATASPLARPPLPPEPGDGDQRVQMHGLTWADFEALLAMRGEASVPRLYFMAGTVELMTPSRFHENHETTFARLLEAWADETGVELSGYGSWTLTSQELERAAEPDECYIVGPDKERPDLAIEVEWSRGGLDKAALYASLGVPELWVLSAKLELQVHVLRDGAYVPAGRSTVLPQLDPGWLASFLGRGSQSAAVREMRRVLRAPT